MKKLLTLLAISAALLGSVAHSEENCKMYLEVGYAHTKLESSGLFSENVGIAAVRFGYNFTPNFAAELFAAAGLDSANVSGASVKVDSAYGFYLKGKTQRSRRQREVYRRRVAMTASRGRSVVSTTSPTQSTARSITPRITTRAATRYPGRP